MPPPVLLQAVPENIAQILRIPAAKRDQNQKNVLTGFYQSTDANLARLRRELGENSVPVNARALGAPGPGLGADEHAGIPVQPLRIRKTSPIRQASASPLGGFCAALSVPCVPISPGFSCSPHSGGL